MNLNCGVYKIANVLTGDFYIGSSVNLYRRFANHRSSLRANRHRNLYLQRSWDKYGEQAFEFSTVLYCDKATTLYFEQALVDGLKPTFNMAKNVTAPMLGRHPTDETKLKLSTANTGHHPTEETRRKISEAHKGERNRMFGKHLSDETRRKLSEANTGELHPLFGTHPTDETRRKMSEANAGERNGMFGKRGELSPLFGTHRSEETKQKISASYKALREAKNVVEK